MPARGHAVPGCAGPLDIYSGGTRPSRAAVSRVGSRHRAAEAPDHAGLCVARSGHGVVQSEAHSWSIRITRSGASSSVTVIDLRIRRQVCEQRHCCLVFLIYGQHTLSYGTGAPS
jgi:hypothetical protein